MQQEAVKSFSCNCLGAALHVQRTTLCTLSMQGGYHSAVKWPTYLPTAGAQPRGWQGRGHGVEESSARVLP